MSNLEHYFENLLFDGKDCRGDVNKNTLTKEEQEAVEICAQYVIYTLFGNRDGFKEFIHSEPKYGYWKCVNGWIYCSVCGSEPPNESNYESNYCPNGGARMDGGEENNG